MKKELFFKVKYGYSVTDQVSISEKELEKAIYAQLKGIPIQLGNSYINGKNIISITPHYHKYTGWHEWYEPKGGEDFEQIQRDCPNFSGVIEAYKNRVGHLMRNNQTNLIGKNVEIPQLENKKEFKTSEESKELADKFKVE